LAFPRNVLTPVASKGIVPPGWRRTTDDVYPSRIVPERSGTKLQVTASASPGWQAAIEGLIVVATLGGPTMFARFGIMRALNRNLERVFDSSRKDKHWGKRKLKRIDETVSILSCHP
jgi:hypothetical protein